MCFDTDDCDWHARVAEDETGTATKPTRCMECNRTIQPGEFVRHVYLQESEVCKHDPDHDDYEGDRGFGVGCPPGCEHDFGETYDYDRCRTCDQLIEAIHQHELAEGCGEHESRPNLEGLYDAINYGDGPAYLAKAEELYPGIVGWMVPEWQRLAARVRRGAVAGVYDDED